MVNVQHPEKKTAKKDSEFPGVIVPPAENKSDAGKDTKALVKADENAPALIEPEQSHGSLGALMKDVETVGVQLDDGEERNYVAVFPGARVHIVPYLYEELQSKTKFETDRGGKRVPRVYRYFIGELLEPAYCSVKGVKLKGIEHSKDPLQEAIARGAVLVPEGRLVYLGFRSVLGKLVELAKGDKLFSADITFTTLRDTEGNRTAWNANVKVNFPRKPLRKPVVPIAVLTTDDDFEDDDGDSF